MNRFFVTVQHCGNVDDLSETLQLATNSQDVDWIKDHLGNHIDVLDFGGFLYQVEGGDFTEIYGFFGNVPYNEKPVFRIRWGHTWRDGV